MTAEEKALKKYPIVNDWIKDKMIEPGEDATHDQQKRSAFIEGWNDRDSLVEAEKKATQSLISDIIRHAASTLHRDVVIQPSLSDLLTKALELRSMLDPEHK